MFQHPTVATFFQLQSQFTATTISFNLLPGVSLSDVEESIDKALFTLNLPPEIRSGFQGTAGMLGAAFWFDLLQKLVNLRGTGPRVEAGQQPAQEKAA